MRPQEISLKVLAAYARDIGRAVVRIDARSMESLGVTEGDVVEVIGKRDGTDARCYRLLPSDEDQGITRIDPALRKMIGVGIDHTVTIRKIADLALSAEEEKEEPTKIEPKEAESPLSSPPEPRDGAGNGAQDAATTATAAIPSAAGVFVLSGSCTDFEKERPKILQFIASLESAARTQSKSKCYSDGKKALGWDFFQLEMDENFVDKLRDIYPDIQKQEAATLEEQLALWMNKQLKKIAKVDYYLKLSDVPHEKTNGFRLNPEHFRDKSNLEDLR